MSLPDDLVRLRHMLDAAEKAKGFAEDRNRANLDSDEIFALALVRLLEIIGEAARGVSVGFRERHPEIPWAEIAGTRDRLIHGYFDVDLDIVWGIVTRDLPPLIAQLEEIIKEEG